MDGETTRRRTFQLLADALDYPRPDLAKVVSECAALLMADNLAAAACLREFGAFVEKTPLGRLEEIYTGAFDLDAAWYPYVGYHLFGESYKRSLFMLGLNERYRTHGFPIDGELPDHLVVLLRFLAVCDDPALIGELVREALLPALEHMGLEGTENVLSPDPRRDGGTLPSQFKAGKRPGRARQEGYWQVLQALHLVLQRFASNNEVRGEESSEKLLVV